MTVSPFLVDTYRAYKRGTAKFVQWLAETAQSTGKIDWLPSKTFNAYKDSGRQEGRIRFEEKQKREAVRIDIGDFEPLATAISSAKVHVPKEILYILEDVIKARKECAVFYKAQSSVIDDADNGGHQHFIEVLETVHTTLNSHSPKRTKSPHSSQEKLKNKSEVMSNIFEMLTLEEMSETATADQSSDQACPEGAVIYKLRRSKEETALAVYCFLKDMTEVRVLVHQTWREFKVRHTTLTTASTTTNYAIEIFQRLNETFIKDFPDYNDHGRIIDLLFDEHSGQNIDCPSGIPKDKLGWFTLRDELRLSPDTFSCRSTFEHYFKNFLLQTMPQDHFPIAVVGEGTEWAAKEQITEQTQVKKCLRWLVAWNDNNKKLDWQFGDVDLLLRAINLVVKEHNAPTWTVFAIQVYINMRRELVGHVFEAFKEQRETFPWIIDNFQYWLDSERSFEEKKCPQNVQRELEAVIKRLSDERLMADRVVEGIACCSTEGVPLSAWTIHPVYCGLLIQHLLTILHRWGVILVSRSNFILVMMHLYNAGLQNGFLKPTSRWADMEYLIGKQEEVLIFAGKRPTELVECHKQFLMTLGVNATKLTATKLSKLARNGMKTTKAARRFAHFSTCVRGPIRYDGAVYPNPRVGTQSEVMLESLEVSYLSLIEEPDAATKAGAPPEEKNALTPSRAFSTFKEAMKDDEMAIRFALPLLNARCAEFINSLGELCKQYVQPKPGTHPATIVEYMLGMASSQAAHNNKFLKSTFLCMWWNLDKFILSLGGEALSTAVRHKHIVSGPKDPRVLHREATMEQIFGGTRLLEDPRTWDSILSFAGTESCVLTRPSLQGKEERRKHTLAQRKEYMKEWSGVEVENGDILGIEVHPTNNGRRVCAVMVGMHDDNSPSI